MEPFLFIPAFFGLGFMLVWYLALVRIGNVGGSHRRRLPLHIVLPLCAVLVFIALWNWSDIEIRSNAVFVVFMTGVGLAWVLVCVALFPWLGLSVRDDALERNNVAATIAACGAMPGVALIYAGGNVGEGPELWHNFFCAGLATATFFALWLLLASLGGTAASIAEERDIATGLRLGAWLLAEGLILGRSIAGDWHSMSETLHDFARDGWGAAGLLLLALPLERMLRPSAAAPFPSWKVSGSVPAALYLTLAAGWLWHVGHW